MTASMLRRAEYATRCAVHAQQLATPARAETPALTPVTVLTIGQMIKRRLTVREYGAYLSKIRPQA